MYVERVFPAYAGMNRRLSENAGSALGVPRICGDEPLMFLGGRVIRECSPHMRG